MFKEKCPLQHNLKCATCLTLNIQCSQIKFCLHTKLRFGFAPPLKMFHVNFSQSNPQKIQSHLAQQIQMIR